MKKVIILSLIIATQFTHSIHGMSSVIGYALSQAQNNYNQARYQGRLDDLFCKTGLECLGGMIERNNYRTKDITVKDHSNDNDASNNKKLDTSTSSDTTLENPFGD